MIYELITPSDPITFLAADDKVAFFCAVILGNGKAGCHREDGHDVPSMMMFMPEETVERVLKENLGTTLGEFARANNAAIAQAFRSFAYGDMKDRQQFDDAIAAIDDPIKLAEFKAKHEERNRTSMSEWVKYAWKLADRHEKIEAEAAR